MKIVIVGVLFLLIASIAGLFYMGYKSREGTAPGLVDGRLASCPASPNCVSSEAGAPQDKKVDPLPVDVWSKLPTTIEAMGGTVTQQERTYISATFTSNIFRFTDDVEFRLADDVVHVRSASRVGHSDMGANRARVDALRVRINAD